MVEVEVAGLVDVMVVDAAGLLVDGVKAFPGDVSFIINQRRSQ